MTEEELREIIKLLKEANLNPQLCDTPIPYYDNPVKCGVPTDPGDVDLSDYVLMPKSVVGMHPEMYLPAEFMKSDVEALRRKHKMNSRGDYLLNRWVKYKMCEKAGLGSYRKMPLTPPNPSEEGDSEGSGHRPRPLPLPSVASGDLLPFVGP